MQSEDIQKLKKAETAFKTALECSVSFRFKFIIQALINFLDPIFLIWFLNKSFKTKFSMFVLFISEFQHLISL